MSCAISTVKYILFIFNFVFTLTGLLLIIIGILANSSASNFKELLAGNVSFASILVIGVGIFIFIVAFFGCCGAIQESHCMVITYTIFLLTIFFIEIGIGILAFVYRAKAQNYLSVTVDNVFDKYPSDNDAKKIVDAVQHQLRCCGTSGPTYWGGSYPKSCCKEDFSDVRYSSTYQSGTGSCPGETWAVGCIEKLTEFTREQLQRISYIAIAVALVEIIGIIFSLCLASSIRRSELRGYV